MGSAVRGDLDEPSEIGEMVRRFYADVAQDDLLGPVFDKVAEVAWSEHLPNLTQFWCRVLLHDGDYRGNPLRAHERIHARSAFTDALFDRWLSLFRGTVDSGWTGPNADHAIAFAERVAAAHRSWLTGTADDATDHRKRTARASLVIVDTSADNTAPAESARSTATPNASR